jgi:hypothetical protein
VLPEAFAHDHQAHIIALLREFREGFDAVVQALVFPDESEEEEDVLPQLVLRFPCFLVKCGIRLEEGVDRVVEFEDCASGREISRPYGPISIERQVEFLPIQEGRSASFNSSAVLYA